MKITIYELLGLVKDGKAPKKIKFINEIYEYKINKEHNFIDYVGIEKETNVKFYLSSHIGNNYISDIFTDEVEIIEEEPNPITKESIEALGYACGEIRKCFENGWNKSLENKPLIEEPKKIEKLDVALLGQCDNWLRCPTNKVTKQDVELNPYIIDNIRENTLYFQRKINELIDEINNLKEK